MGSDFNPVARWWGRRLVWAWALACSGAWAADAPGPQRLRIVGGLAGLNQYTHNEEPFWSQELSRLSQGRYTAEIAPFDRAGVPGSEMLRLLQLGVVPFGTALLSNISVQYPEYAAPDLAGLNPDMATLRKTVNAFRPYLEKSLRERVGVQVLAIYVYPAQVVFCKKPMVSLSDLKGRRIRVSSATQSDFIAALGATPVLVSFAQLVPNLASGNTECAITGTMSGNNLKLYEVTSHVHTLPISWGLSVFGANLAAWNALPGDLRALLSRELPKLENAIWTESEKETAQGLICNRGSPECTGGTKGKMTEVNTTGDDERLRKSLFQSQVLPRWLQRCNGQCETLWNQTIGPTQQLMAPSTK
ncbi:MAG: TRAP transporter substrate-binding protein [Rhodoferax sp.]|nr:TRAP transporter substrate-binding protein [Rhodoferax sp.]